MSNSQEERGNRPHAPYRTLLFLLGLGGLSSALMFVFPSSGIQIGEDIDLVFLQPEEVLPGADTTQDEQNIEDINEFLESYTEEIDSTAILDSLEKAEELEKIRRQKLLKFQYSDSFPFPLQLFFERLNELEKDPQQHVRAMHYGDSQIEGDRITGYLRTELQKEFGGYGPGLLPALEVVPSGAINQENSGNWQRYTVFGRKDTIITHDRYGVLANFARFSPPEMDSLKVEVDSGLIVLKPSRITYAKSRRYSKLRLWFEGHRDSLDFSLFAGDSLIEQKLFQPLSYQSLNWNLGSTPDELRISFKGKDSPDVYGLSLESPTGIHLDNIGMRGSSGTIFRKMDKALLKKQLDELQVSLLILQFGGNTVPYVKNDEKAENYGKWFGSQIRLLKQLIPGVSILVIGPSDMATKVKNNFETYPYLLPVRNALKKAAFDHGCAFWDLYEVMGGKNSMEVWVNAEPPLAGKDYVHFTPKGAKKVAELLHKAFSDEYEKWKEVK